MNASMHPGGDEERKEVATPQQIAKQKHISEQND